MILRTALALFITASAVFIQSCKKKELPPGFIGSIQFYCKGILDEDSIVFEAGKRSAFMNTFILEKDSVAAGFTGELSAPGRGGLRFTFFDQAYRDALSEQDAEVLFAGGERNFRYVFRDSVAGFTALRLYNYAPPPGVAQTIQWTLPGMFPAYGPFVDALLKPTGTFQLRCYAASGIHEDTLINSIEVNENGIVCPLQFNYVRTGPLTYRLTAQGNFSSYTWTFPGGQTASGAEVNWVAPAEGLYSIRLDGISLAGCTRNWTRHLSTSSLVNSGVCADYYYQDTNHVPDEISLHDAFKSVEITWEKQDESGTIKTYKSLKNFNRFASGQFFSIEASGKYRTNSEGTPTWWIRGRTACWLYNHADRSDSVYFKSDSLRIAVGIYLQ